MMRHRLDEDDSVIVLTVDELSDCVPEGLRGKSATASRIRVLEGEVKTDRAVFTAGTDDFVFRIEVDLESV